MTLREALKQIEVAKAEVLDETVEGYFFVGSALEGETILTYLSSSGSLLHQIYCLQKLTTAIQSEIKGNS